MHGGNGWWVFGAHFLALAGRLNSGFSSRNIKSGLENGASRSRKSRVSIIGAFLKKRAAGTDPELLFRRREEELQVLINGISDRIADIISNVTFQ